MHVKLFIFLIMILEWKFEWKIVAEEEKIKETKEEEASAWKLEGKKRVNVSTT